MQITDTAPESQAIAEQRSRRVVLITGASRGIGAAIALELARTGHEPVLAVRNPATAKGTSAEITAAGGRGLVVPCDVADAASIRAAFDACVATHGRVDAVVNNAGIIEPIGHVGDVDPDEWGRALAVNVMGPLLVTQAALRELVQHQGVLINVSTGAAHHVKEGWSAYCASKAALAMLTRSVDLEYGQRGVCVYGLVPGLVDTGMQDAIRASGMNEISRIPKDQLRSPAFPARLAAWLLAERPAELRGKEIDIRDPDIQLRAFGARLPG